MPNCANPGTVRHVISHDGVRAECTLSHCEDGYVILDVDFEPRNQGARVVIQGHFRYQNRKGFEAATRRVIFYDDGTVVGFGNRAQGVRFQQKPWFRNADHQVRIEATLR
jgi:hypothetical protein